MKVLMFQLNHFLSSMENLTTAPCSTAWHSKSLEQEHSNCQAIATSTMHTVVCHLIVLIPIAIYRNCHV
jgi:hypothetical protein